MTARLDLASEMEGGPPLHLPLCGNKDRVSTWINEKSGQRGAVGIQSLFCVQSSGVASVGGCVQGVGRFCGTKRERLGQASVLRAGSAHAAAFLRACVAMNSSGNIYQSMCCIFAAIVLYKCDWDYVAF